MQPLPDEIPFHQARDISVKIHVAPKGKADVYVDEIITIAADIKDNLERITKAPVTVMHAVADNAKATGKIKRNDIVALDKMLGEGAPEEEKICLGWILNTRSLQVRLPSHKAVAWTSQINSILNGRSVSSKDLESVLGRLENIAQVMTPLGHFLSNIRQLQIIADRKGHNVKLNKRVREDLELAKAFIDKTHTGVGMNLITFRVPDVIHICDLGLSEKMLQSEKFQHLNDNDFDRKGRSRSDKPDKLGRGILILYLYLYVFQNKYLVGKKKKWTLSETIQKEGAGRKESRLGFVGGLVGILL